MISKLCHYLKLLSNIFLSQTSIYLKHLSVSNISLSQTSLYLKHLSISNISLPRTFLYLKHPSTSNIPLPRTSLYLEHLSISNIPLSQTSLYLKHLSISNFPTPFYLFISNQFVASATKKSFNTKEDYFFQNYTKNTQKTTWRPQSTPCVN